MNMKQNVQILTALKGKAWRKAGEKKSLLKNRIILDKLNKKENYNK